MGILVYSTIVGHVNHTHLALALALVLVPLVSHLLQVVECLLRVDPRQRAEHRVEKLRILHQVLIVRVIRLCVCVWGVCVCV